MLRSSRLPTSGLLVLGACAGVSPLPEAADPESLPIAVQSAADSARRDALVDECVRNLVLRRYDEAERAAEAALGLDPRSARARAVRGMVLLHRAADSEPPDLRLANSGEAETVLAERLAPADPFVAWVRALFLGESGHLSAAAAAAEAGLDRAAGAPPEERAPLLGLAGTYRYELGEERAALPLLQAYVGLRPDDATANFRIGSCLLRMSLLPTGAPETQDLIAQRQAENAARAFGRCVDLAPGDSDAMLAITTATLRAAELAGRRGETAEREELLKAAVEQLGRAAERFPESPEVRFRLGVVEEERARPDAAAAAYGAALDIDPDHLGAVLNLAAMRDAAGERRIAAELLGRALAIDAARGGLSDKERARIRQRLQADG